MQGSKGDADIKDRLLVTVEEGEGGMTGESSSETYTLPHVKCSQWEFAVGNPKPVLCNNLEGLDGEGGGREV